MALAEVGRFLDLSEAQAAAAALRASGMDVFIQNENWGQTEAYLQLAMGGFRLWTDEADAPAARAFINDCRTEPSGIAPQGGRAQTLLALALTLTSGPIAGWLAAPFRRRRDRLPDWPEV